VLQPFLRLIVSTLSGYVYNERTLKAEIKPLSVPGGGAAAAQKKEKVDPLVLQQRAGSVTAPHLTTVFVSHLGPEVTTAQLQEHFLPCGEVLAAKVAVDKKTGESKVTQRFQELTLFQRWYLIIIICLYLSTNFHPQCTGLVQFVTEAGRSAALLLNKTVFCGTTIGVSPSRFSLITVAQAPSDPTHAVERKVTTVSEHAAKESTSKNAGLVADPADAAAPTVERHAAPVVSSSKSSLLPK
jgi:RNA recognition motif-containing protein